MKKLTIQDLTPGVPALRSLAGVIAILVASDVLLAQQTIPQPFALGYDFAGPALHLPCVAELKRRGERDFISAYKGKSRQERQVCLNHLLRSLTPAPDFSANEFRRALRRDVRGRYELTSPNKAMTDRLGVNIHVAGAVAALARHELIEELTAIDPLVRCLDHPWLEVGASCNGALVALTGHPYGNDFFGRRMPWTPENHRQVVADWQELLQVVRRPIYDSNLASTSRAAVQAVMAALHATLPLSPGPAGYFKRRDAPQRLTTAVTPNVTPGGAGEVIAEIDVGRHNTANWPRNESVTSVALLLFRPGVRRARSGHTISQRFRFTPDYRERFDALDVEVRFIIGTSDAAIRRRSIDAVRRGLAALRALNVKESR